MTSSVISDLRTVILNSFNDDTVIWLTYGECGFTEVSLARNGPQTAKSKILEWGRGDLRDDFSGKRVAFQQWFFFPLFFFSLSF